MANLNEKLLNTDIEKFTSGRFGVITGVIQYCVLHSNYCGSINSYNKLF